MNGDNKMKIAYILPSLENRGPIIFTKNLIQSLKGLGLDITVFYFKESLDVLDLEVPCFKINFFKSFDFKNYDIIHTTMLKPDLYAFYHSACIRRKHVVSMHNIIGEDLNYNYKPFRAWIMKRVWQLILSRNLPIIVSSLEMKQYYNNFLFGKKNLNIIPYGIPLKKCDDVLVNDQVILDRLKSKYFIIGSVGLAIKRKGFKQLIPLLKCNPSLAVVIIGDGIDRENLEQLAKINGVSDRFLILGFRNDSHNYYKYFDIYALVSYSEGFGLAMMEAMALSLPVVCSNLPIYKEYFTNESVALFELNDEKSLNKAVNRVIRDLCFFKKSSALIYESIFSDNLMAKRHFEYYKKLLDK